MLGDGGRSQSWNARSIHGLRQPVDTDADPSAPRAPARKRHLKFRAVAIAVRYAHRLADAEAGHGADGGMRGFDVFRAFLALLPRAYFVSDVVWEKTAVRRRSLGQRDQTPSATKHLARPNT